MCQLVSSTNQASWLEFTFALQPQASKLYQIRQTIFCSIRKWNFLLRKLGSDVTILFCVCCHAFRSNSCRQLKLKWISKNISSTLQEIFHKSWTSPKHKFAFSLATSSSLQTIYLINKWNSLFSKARDGKVSALLAAFLDIGCLWQFCSTYTHLQILRAVDWKTSSIFIKLPLDLRFFNKYEQNSTCFWISSKAQAKKLKTFCVILENILCILCKIVNTRGQFCLRYEKVIIQSLEQPFQLMR